MKKILLLISGIFTVFCFLYINIEIKEQYIKEESINSYLGDPLSFMVYDLDGETITEDEKYFLLSLAKEYSITLASNTGSSEELINQFLFISDEAMLKRYHVDDSFNYSKENILSTDDNPMKVGSISPYDDSFTITKKSFLNDDYKRIYGWYNVFGEKKEAFFQAFKAHFPNDIERIDVEDNQHMIEEMDDASLHFLQGTSQDKLLRFAAIFIASSLIILLMFFANKSREISIKKLHGYSNFDVIREDLMRLTIAMFILDCLLLVAMTLLLLMPIYPIHFRLFYHVGFALVLKYVALLLVYISILFYIKGIGISILLKKKRISRFILYVNTGMRICFVFLLCGSIFEMLPNFTLTLKTAYSYHSFLEESKDYAHSVATKGFLDQELNEKMNEQVRKLQETEDNLIGVYTGNYLNSFNLPYKWVDVNKNYISKYPIYDVTGNKLINLEKDTTYLLVPESIKNDNQSYRTMIEPIKGFEDVEEIIIQDGQEIFTFNMNINESGLGYILQSPILVSNDLSWNSIYFENMDNKGFSNMDEKIQEVIPNISYLYEYVNDEASPVFNRMVSQAIYEGIMILLYITLLILLLIQYILLLFDVHQKEYIVKKIHGYSFFERYDTISLICVLSYLSNFVIFLYLGLSNFALIILMLLLVFDLVFTVFMIKSIERKTLQNILKGG